ncbi:glucose-1-phosphate thymidylyltransferase RfbA [Streptomyces sp. DSM 44915]|uniref:Glucose-1-phosphate thymidylyltransferase n=1 Tax=Streptomyces chisholmiae TaxID=3075540 RepID=A0ABU2JMC8_9ACTN|nr:glucose-1-phosphate thymidylyltransferase RfbA [Streptomyces sp. DSM 44915]MDT0266132.1 glucose-1-phosphate thymidylyltransferase RfbA [Streptomyces sp. DSM 44915]
MKGVILAGGHGTRLYPITLGVSKQMLSVHDKPLIYYPLSTLLLAGVTDIQIISSPEDVGSFRRLLGDGSDLGISLSYAEQDKPRGVADAFRVAARHIGNDPVALILGDNLFHGAGFSTMLHDHARDIDGCVLFGYPVREPERYGVATTDGRGRLLGLEEKPSAPRSDLAVTGLYFYDNEVLDIARDLAPSERGELEITDVNRVYLARGKARLVELGRGFVWLDTGTHDALTAAAQYVQLMERRQNIRIACVEEIAWRMGLISEEDCYRLGRRLEKSPYGQYLMSVVRHSRRADGLE